MITILIPIKERNENLKALWKSLPARSDVSIKELLDEAPDESFAHKVNRGVVATTDDIIILHSDMVVKEDWFKELETFINLYPHTILGSKLIFENGIIQHYGGHINYKADAIHPERGLVDMGQFDDVRDVPFVTFGGVFIPRSVIEEVGYLDESIRPWGWEDVDYGLRAQKLGISVKCTPAAIVHKESVDAKKFLNIAEVLKKNKEYVIKKHHLEEYSIPEWA